MSYMILLGSNEAYVIYGTDVSDVSDVSSCVAGAINRAPTYCRTTIYVVASKNR